VDTYPSCPLRREWTLTYKDVETFTTGRLPLGGGNIVHIKLVDVHRISHYLAKYLTKELLLSAPDRSRRVTTSRSIHLIQKLPGVLVWTLLQLSVFHLFSIFSRVASDIVYDEENFLSSFSIPAGSYFPTRTTLTLVRAGNVSFTVLFVW
jgi:hypothetical protein